MKSAITIFLLLGTLAGLLLQAQYGSIELSLIISFIFYLCALAIFVANKVSDENSTTIILTIIVIIITVLVIYGFGFQIDGQGTVKKFGTTCAWAAGEHCSPNTIISVEGHGNCVADFDETLNPGDKVKLKYGWFDGSCVVIR